jgi:hypothetical protein
MQEEYFYNFIPHTINLFTFVFKDYLQCKDTVKKLEEYLARTLLSVAHSVM